MSDQQSFWGPTRDTLEEARRMVAHGRGDGIDCPCCGQFVKVYRRKLNASMAQALIALERSSGGGFVHLFDFLAARKIQHSDAPALRHWDLIEERGEERDDGNPRAGYYRITPRGRNYVTHPDAVLPRYALVFNNELLGFSEDVTTIRQALGVRFRYDELMEPAP